MEELDSHPEVIFASTRHCTMYDAETGNSIQVFKGSQLAPKTLALVAEDYIFGIIDERPILKIWTASKKVAQGAEMTLPGQPQVIAVTSCGQYCFMGISKDLYIWQVASGELLTVVSEHYQDISSIRVSADDCYVITGGRDGQVLVWLFTDLVNVAAGYEKKPRFRWAHHSAEVTDIFVSSMGGYARVATASTDQSCKLYELCSGDLMCTFILESPVYAVAMDPLENFLFLGDEKGCLFRINLFERLPRELHTHELVESRFEIHQSKIISLTVSSEGTKLVSASGDGTIKIWQIEPLAYIRTIPVDGNLTNAFIAPKPMPFIDESVKPQFSIGQFRRELESEYMKPDFLKVHESRIRARTLSPVIELSSLLPFNPSDTDSAMIEKSSGKMQEDIYQKQVTGSTVTELSAINHQLYSYMTTTVLKKFEPSSP